MATRKQVKTQRRKLRLAQGSVCAGCGLHLPSGKRTKRHHPDYPTFDHVVARSKGGGRTLANGLLKHNHCNRTKADKPPTGCDLIWLAVVQVRLEALQSEPARPVKPLPICKRAVSMPIPVCKG